MAYDAHDDPQHIAGVAYMNPGTGPVEGTKGHHATENLSQLLKDAGAADAVSKHEGHDGHGRYRFTVEHSSGRTVEVEMPGLPLEQVRFTGAPDQSIWHFPRLYVDGSSWVWCYAVGMVRSALTGEE